MRGADVVATALGQLGASAVFTNPGTSELALVDALARSGPHPVLVAQELVATGAADAHARLTGIGVALLHLGPGLANGLAFVHDARRARSPLLVLLGEHPRSHAALDPPLAMRTSPLAAAVDAPFVMVEHPEFAGRQIVDAANLARARRGPVIVALDAVAMEREVERVEIPAPEAATPVALVSDRIQAAASLLATGGAALLLGGRALTPAGRRLAAGIGQRTSARLLAETFPGYSPHGRGSGPIERLAYLPALARDQLQGVRALISVGSELPVGWFAHPGVEAREWSLDAPALRVDAADADELEALGALADALGAGPVELADPSVVPPPTPASPLDADTLAAVIARAVTEGVVIVDEARTAAPALFEKLAAAAPHSYLGHPGGAIGEGLSLALGAATLGRRVLAVVADGGALYAPQALWSLAREGAEATIVIANNGGYRILEIEQQLAGWPTRPELTRLEHPAPDYAALARSFGASAERVHSAGELAAALAGARGLTVVEALLSR